MFGFGGGGGARRPNNSLRPRITQQLQAFAQRRRSRLVGQAIRRKLSALSSSDSTGANSLASSATSATGGNSADMTWTWRQISLGLCVFGFLREIRPSEPFVTDFMMQPWRNVTVDDVNRYVFPLGTYSYAAQLVIVFLLTDYLRYKPLIVCSGIAGCIVWSLLIWTRSLRALQLCQLFYGTYMATEIAYYTYIYAKVDRRHYGRVTAHTRAAILVGRFVACSLGQLLVFANVMDFLQLNYITVAAQLASTLWAFGLPSVPTSVYFHRTPVIDAERDEERADVLRSMMPAEQHSICASVIAVPHCDNPSGQTSQPSATTKTPENPEHQQRSFRLLWSQFRRAYRNVDVLIWSIWYAVGMCGYLQAISYVQVLWAAIDRRENAMIWNGAVEAVNTLLGAAVAMLAGHLHSERLSRVQLLGALIALSCGQGASVLVASQTDDRNVSYVAYGVFYVLYSFTITVASAEVAKGLENDSYGLVFGINTLAALVLQTVLTLVVVADGGLALSVRDQYAVLSGYYFVLAGVFGIALMRLLWRLAKAGECVRLCRRKSVDSSSRE